MYKKPWVSKSRKYFGTGSFVAGNLVAIELSEDSKLRLTRLNRLNVEKEKGKSS